ncbi:MULTISPECIES: IclR family transcriptional regulator domain-containing protein [unclassified Streptomyces]|uniref:IclR family transcriptional regulator domain-containing protein n=1 Tax=unclassified Streptomyces TaxID=2593676 RepID=UPI00225BCE6D|nr:MULTISPECIES: IclR family transcriptional regulator C-terminal domain-containing protein [unclassified Streptomyces]MCX4793078.1 helix-turn-helix domain-containing protein [Streptomyces sp. NBC_01242]WSP59438.1 helix-turn-helix domain-containing protein [Streptomyces sp. NBC_01241]WSP60971.1 helix-turn-helix domain-containing protein [Streptomyces sp. NBC_01240]WSU20042.1 helix-turn-helix domain-containing protein [Streptomyces sp. NBC_01108]
MPPTRTIPSEPPVPAEAVAPLMRGITVLRRLTDADGTLSSSDLERATGLARSTVDRVTTTLARMGYVRLDGRDVTLAPGLMELGNAYLASIRLPALFRERADALADELDESVSLAVPDGDGIRFIHQAARRRAMSLSFRMGDLLPAERTAPGALFAAGWGPAGWEAWRQRRAADPDGARFPSLPPRPSPTEDDFTARVAAARADDRALDDQLIEAGLVALAVPVRAPGGDVVCALSVVSHTSRHTAGGLVDTLLPRLRAAAAAMEDRLRTAPPARSVPATGVLASWTAASKQELGREFIESLARGLTVLTAFGDGGETLTLSAVAQATGLSRATARRALITLEHLGYVAVDGREHRLTPRVLGLGYPPLSRTTLSLIAQPHLGSLAGRIKESASLAVLVDDSVQYVARSASHRIMSVNITVGTRFPAYATSLGRVLLADLTPVELDAALTRTELRPLAPRTLTHRTELEAVLDRVRTQGHALVDKELEAGLRSIAVPVRDRAGAAVASINVAMHSSSRTIEECEEQILPQLRDTALKIETELHTAERFTRVAVA